MEGRRKLHHQAIKRGFVITTVVSPPGSVCLLVYLFVSRKTQKLLNGFYTKHEPRANPLNVGGDLDKSRDPGVLYHRLELCVISQIIHGS